MSMTATVAETKPRANPTVEHEPEEVTVGNQPLTSDNHYYRIIIGVHDNYGSVNYICYRKDRRHEFVMDNVNFDSNLDLEDQRFIFDENDFENLQDYLAQYDDRNLVTIAQIGRKKIDPISLLPII